MAMQRLDEGAHGVFVIAATPFLPDGALDLASTDRLVDFYLDEGVHGITVLGVMGEAPKLSDGEQEQFARHVLARVDARVPVIVGVSNPGLDNLSRLSRSAMDHGAAGVMIAGNPGLRTEEQVLGYFAQALAKIGEDVPVCVQDYPPTTTVYVSVDTVNTLIRRHDQIVMFKHEDCPGHRKLSRLRRAAEGGEVRRVSILTGNGGLYVPQELARGADGIMTGFAFPGMLVEVYRRFRGGDAAGAEDLFDHYLPVLRHEQQFGLGLALRKETLRLRGVLASAAARAPGPSLDDDDRAELGTLLARLKHKLEGAGEALPTGL
jgi:4-hydroxy-tetrahydrodipicolinate synthase